MLGSDASQSDQVSRSMIVTSIRKNMHWRRVLFRFTAASDCDELQENELLKHAVDPRRTSKSTCYPSSSTARAAWTSVADLFEIVH